MDVQSLGSWGVLASLLGLSFAAGVNLYLSVLAIGLGIRFGWITNIPQDMQVLSHPVVLGLAGLLYVAEFVADKVPFITPIWDAIHTVIRPVGGAVLAMQTTAHLDPVLQAAATLLGGSIALGAHSSKAGLRLLAHATPEPATHTAISFAEDVGVISLIGLAYNYPEVAIVVVGILLLGVAIFTPILLRVLRFLCVGISGRVRSWFGGHTSAEALPPWLQADLRPLKLPGKPHILCCYTRSGAAITRMRVAYIVHSENQWWLVQKRIIGHNVQNLSDGGVERISLSGGWVYDVVRIKLQGRKRLSFYVTKDWSRAAAELIQSAAPELRETEMPAEGVSEPGL